ncbi:helix-turn-helix transcriptional regulator [Nonomuraea rosea]
MTSASGPGELDAFLKARRARPAPQDLGLPEQGPRRKVAELRREEVAQLAAISVDYYTRLEQGRVRASASVLATPAQALRLDDDQQRYPYQLGGKIDARRACSASWSSPPNPVRHRTTRCASSPRGRPGHRAGASGGLRPGDAPEAWPWGSGACLEERTASP